MQEKVVQNDELSTLKEKCALYEKIIKTRFKDDIAVLNKGKLLFTSLSDENVSKAKQGVLDGKNIIKFDGVWHQVKKIALDDISIYIFELYEKKINGDDIDLIDLVLQNIKRGLSGFTQNTNTVLGQNENANLVASIMASNSAIINENASDAASMLDDLMVNFNDSLDILKRFDTARELYFDSINFDKIQARGHKFSLDMIEAAKQNPQLSALKDEALALELMLGDIASNTIQAISSCDDGLFDLGVQFGEAGEILPQIVCAAKATDAASAKLHDASFIVDEYLQIINTRIFSTLAKLEHGIYMLNLSAKVLVGKSGFKSVLSHECNLGKWYCQGKGIRHLNETASFPKLGPIHDELHERCNALSDDIDHQEFISKDKVIEELKKIDALSIKIFNTLQDIMKESEAGITDRMLPLLEQLEYDDLVM